MRVLDSRECKAIGGAGAPNVAEVFHQTGPNSYMASINGVMTSVTCRTPLSASFHLGLSSTYKILNADTGVTISLPPNCETVIIDTVHHSVLRCESGESKCTYTNTITGESKQVSIEADDSGLEQLAQAEGIDPGDLLADNSGTDTGNDWSASGDDGAGNSGGDGGDSGGDGGDGGGWGDGGDMGNGD